MRKYYQIVETQPNTRFILEECAVHYGSIILGARLYKKFVARLEDEEALVLKLQYAGEIDLYEMSAEEIQSLTMLGFIQHLRYC